MGKPTVLVTGGAGFIGTNFVARMVSIGHQVTVFDKLTYAGGRDNLAGFGDKVRLIVGDICDPVAINDALRGHDWVVHFAAESHNTRSEIDPDIFYQTNVKGTETVLKAAEANNIQRFVHISTDEIYGSRENGYSREDDKELGDGQATSAYSKSKAQADDLAIKASHGNVPVIVVRPTNNFGPWQFPEKALPRWITNLLLGQKVPIWGEGNQIRDWLYARATAEAIEFLLHHGTSGEAYNIAANHQPEITNREAATMLCEILGKDPVKSLDFIPDPRPNHDFRYALNTSKIRALGWQGKLDLRKEFQETVAWYQENPRWWQKRKAEAERIYR